MADENEHGFDHRMDLDNVGDSKHERIAAELIKRFHELDGHEDVRVLILLDDGETGGAAMSGYADEEQAFQASLAYVQALAEASGNTLLVMPTVAGPSVN